jgi:hypothetical protein
MAGPNPWVRENYSAFKKIKEGNRESIITWIKDIYGLKPFLNLEPEKKIILQTELNHFINLIQLDNPKKQYLKDIVYAINMILREMEDNFLVRKYIDKIPVINKLINGL